MRKTISILLVLTVAVFLMGCGVKVSESVESTGEDQVIEVQPEVVEVQPVVEETAAEDMSEESIDDEDLTIYDDEFDLGEI